MNYAIKTGLPKRSTNLRRESIERQILNMVNNKTDAEIGRRRSSKTGAMLRLLYSGQHDCFVMGTEPNLNPNFNYGYRTSETRDVIIHKKDPSLDVDIWVDNAQALWLDLVAPHKPSKESEQVYLKRFIFQNLEETYLGKVDKVLQMEENLTLEYDAGNTEFKIIVYEKGLPTPVYKRKIRCFEDYALVLTEIGYEIQSKCKDLNNIIGAINAID